MPLHTLQLSYRPRQHRVPQALKVLAWGIAAWGMMALAVWLIGLAV